MSSESESIWHILGDRLIPLLAPLSWSWDLTNVTHKKINF